MNSQSDYRERIYANYATNFQDAPKIFDENSAWRWGRAYKHYLRNWLPRNNQANILDMACGGGKLLYSLKRFGYDNVSGVDISPEQVLLSRQVTPNVTEANVLEFLDTHKATYDFITGLDIVEHFYKPEVLPFLDLCQEALKPGGRLVLQTCNADSPWGTVHRYGDFTHEVSFNPNSLSRLLALAGFKDIESREIGPVPIGHSMLSSGRNIIWQSIRMGLKLWNLAETGHAGSGIFTRIFIISGVKR